MYYRYIQVLISEIAQIEKEIETFIWNQFLIRPGKILNQKRRILLSFSFFPTYLGTDAETERFWNTFWTFYLDHVFELTLEQNSRNKLDLLIAFIVLKIFVYRRWHWMHPKMIGEYYQEPIFKTSSRKHIIGKPICQSIYVHLEIFRHRYWNWHKWIWTWTNCIELCFGATLINY